MLPPCEHSLAHYKSAGLAPARVITAQLVPEDADAREKAAQLEIECKKKRVGVLVNKGAYQYITDGTDPATIGR
ncbi:hypothetical protein D3C85_1728090 [compost metagenome]